MRKPRHTKQIEKQKRKKFISKRVKNVFHKNCSEDDVSHFYVSIENVQKNLTYFACKHCASLHHTHASLHKHFKTEKHKKILERGKLRPIPIMINNLEGDNLNIVYCKYTAYELDTSLFQDGKTHSFFVIKPQDTKSPLYVCIACWKCSFIYGSLKSHFKALAHNNTLQSVDTSKCWNTFTLRKVVRDKYLIPDQSFVADMYVYDGESNNYCIGHFDMSTEEFEQVGPSVEVGDKKRETLCQIKAEKLRGWKMTKRSDLVEEKKKPTVLVEKSFKKKFIKQRVPKEQSSSNEIDSKFRVQTQKCVMNKNVYPVVKKKRGKPVQFFHPIEVKTNTQYEQPCDEKDTIGLTSKQEHEKVFPENEIVFEENGTRFLVKEDVFMENRASEENDPDWHEILIPKTNNGFHPDLTDNDIETLNELDNIGLEMNQFEITELLKEFEKIHQDVTNEFDHVTIELNEFQINQNEDFNVEEVIDNEFENKNNIYELHLQCDIINQEEINTLQDSTVDELRDDTFKSLVMIWEGPNKEFNEFQIIQNEDLNKKEIKNHHKIIDSKFEDENNIDELQLQYVGIINEEKINKIFQDSTFEELGDDTFKILDMTLESEGPSTKELNEFQIKQSEDLNNKETKNHNKTIDNEFEYENNIDELQLQYVDIINQEEIDTFQDSAFEELGDDTFNILDMIVEWEGQENLDYQQMINVESCGHHDILKVRDDYSDHNDEVGIENKSKENDEIKHEEKPTQKKAHFQCKKCDFKALLRVQLERHSKSKHSVSNKKHKYSCYYCEYKARSKYNMASHVRRDCPTYRQISNQWKADKIKKKERSGMKYSYSCSQCWYKTKNKQSLENHFRKQCHAGAKNEQVKSILKQNEECEICKDVITNYSSHMKAHEIELVYMPYVDDCEDPSQKCSDPRPSCHIQDPTDTENTIPNENSQDNHQDVIHPPSASSNKNASFQKKFICDRCNCYTTIYRANLTHHVFHQHREVFKFWCDYCPFASMDGSLISQHCQYIHIVTYC